MLAIKLQRIGKKHQPSYRLVVAVNRSKMAAPPVEDLGSYSPKTKMATLKNERVAYWLGVGAQPTMTVHNLLVKHGIVTAPKKAIKMKKAVVAEVPAAVAGGIAKPETAMQPEATAVAEEMSAQAEEIKSVTGKDISVEMPNMPVTEVSNESASHESAIVEEKPDNIEITLTQIKD